MLQEVFRLPWIDLPIYGFGLMLVIGFLAAAQLGRRLAHRFGLNGELFVNAALLALLAGVAGARLSHILENLDDFTDPNRSVGRNVWHMLDLRSGGLTFFGGFLLAIPVLLIYLRRKRLPLRKSMDIIAPCVMVGLGFGRIGCFLNGCCHGAECDLPWAVRFPYLSIAYVDQKIPTPDDLLTIDPQTGQRRPLTLQELRGQPPLLELARAQRSRPVHPAQLYSSFNAFFIAAIALAYLTLSPPPGCASALVLMLYGTSRFLLETVRVEPPVLGPLSISMVISLFLAPLGLAMWLVFGRMAPSEAARPLQA